ncbi:MAG: hypothetical protein ACRERE_43720 [Candidatus Entotheonellia bacterium]
MTGSTHYAINPSLWFPRPGGNLGTTDDFAQLQLWFVDYTQWRYEVIRCNTEASTWIAKTLSS